MSLFVLCVFCLAPLMGHNNNDNRINSATQMSVQTLCFLSAPGPLCFPSAECPLRAGSDFVLRGQLTPIPCEVPFTLLHAEPKAMLIHSMEFQEKTLAHTGHLWLTVFIAHWAAQMGFMSSQSKYLKWKMETRQNNIILTHRIIAFLLSFLLAL